MKKKVAFLDLLYTRNSILISHNIRNVKSIGGFPKQLLRINLEILLLLNSKREVLKQIVNRRK